MGGALSKHAIQFTVNDNPYNAEVEARLLLSDFLRHDLGLTGTHVGCEQGACGVCTVLLNGEPVRSCLMLAVQADGHRIQTVEGLGTPEALHPLQQAFHEAHGLQCGFCTPGIVMTFAALMARDEKPGEEELVAAMSGHTCRCTGYQGIRKAAKALAEGSAGQGAAA